MSMKLYKEVYEQLINKDLEALKAMPDNVERQHIEDVLKDSINQYYPARKSANQWHDLKKNPNDLPPDKPVCVVFETSFNIGYGVDVYDQKRKTFFKCKDVLAWIELPEFKRE